MLTRLSSLIATLTLALACATSAPAHPALETPSACAGSLEDISAEQSEALGTAVPSAAVVAIEVRGARSVPETLVRDAIALEVGAMLDGQAIRADIRRILALRVYEDVRAHIADAPGGVAVIYELRERPMIASARLIGEGGAAARHRVERLAGEVFQPGRLQRLSQKITSDRRREGFAEATARVAAQRGEEGVAVCLVVDAGRRWVIDELELEGNEAIDDDALMAVMTTLEGRLNAEGGIYRADLLEADLQRMVGLYYDAGHVTARIGAPEPRWDGEALRVSIPITEGPVYRLRELRVTGDLAGPASEYEAFLDLDEGMTFDRSAIAVAIERLRVREQSRGNFSAIPMTELDDDGHWVDVEVRVDDLDAPEPSTPRESAGGAQLFDRELQGPDPSLAPAEAP